MTIISRYLAREALSSWVGVTLVLLLIICSHRFARILGEAAAGKLPGGAVFELLMYTSVGFLTVLIPVGFFLGLLMTFGRLYRDSEMAALNACGVGPKDLYRPVMALAVLVAVLVGWVTLTAAPWAADQALQVRRTAEKEAELGMFESGRFKSARGGQAVFYAERVDEQGRLHGLFLSQRGEDEQALVRAKRGVQRVNPETGQRLLVLEEGVRYDGKPGRADFRVLHFAEHGVEITPSAPDLTTTKREVVPTAALAGSEDPLDVAELQWRLSAPLMALVLAVIAVPLSRTRPREGRYGRVVLGVLLYVAYSNLLGVARLALEREQIPAVIGLWPVHILFLLGGLALLAHNNGWRHTFGIQGARA